MKNATEHATFEAMNIEIAYRNGEVLDFINHWGDNNIFAFCLEDSACKIEAMKKELE